MTGTELINSLLTRLLNKHDDRPGSQIRVSAKEKLMKPYILNEPIGIIDFVHTELKALQDQGLIDIKWQDHDLIQYVSLRDAKKLAVMIGYTMLGERFEVAFSQLQNSLANNNHFQKLSSDIYEQWRSKGRYEGFLVDEPDILTEALIAAEALTQRKNDTLDEIDERHFSSQLFSNSKRFKSISGRTAKVLRLADPDLPPDIVPEELFQLFGVVKMKHPVFVSGNIEIQAENGQTIRASFPPAVGIWPEHIVGITCSHDLTKLTTIENQATFLRYIEQEKEPDEVVLFTSGIPSPALRRIYATLVDLKPLTIQHWGDIDIGGFVILNILEKTAGQAITAIRMSPSDYHGIKEYKVMTEKEAHHLQKLALNLSPLNREIANKVASIKSNFEQESYTL